MRNSRRFAHFSTFFPSQKVFDICGRYCTPRLLPVDSTFPGAACQHFSLIHYRTMGGDIERVMDARIWPNAQSAVR